MDIKNIFEKVKDSRPIRISVGQLKEAELKAKKEVFDDIEKVRWLQKQTISIDKNIFEQIKKRHLSTKHLKKEKEEK